MKPCKLCQSDMEEGAFDYCPKCRHEWKKPRDRYYYLKKRQTDEYRQEASQRALKWNTEHYEHYKRISREHRKQLQYESLSFYSNSDIPKCVHCGETNISVLALDHINHDGKQDSTNRGGMAGLYLRSLKLKDKSKYQTLCYNCNWKKHLANLRSKWKNDKESIRQRSKSLRYRTTCISHYSNVQNKCCQCGNKDIEVLCLDHTNDDGNVHRKQVNKIGRSFYVWLIRNNFPSILQVLCLNCNIVKTKK